MKTRSPGPAGRTLALGALLFALVLPASAVSPAKALQARRQFARAERLREALNGRPAEQRSRRDYQRVIDAYRRVYYLDPLSRKADPSVVAVAELLAAMGRQFDDTQALQASVRQFEFLRAQYPGSRHRADALFTIAELYKDDLNDPALSQATFEEFVRQYPRNRLTGQAAQAIAELNRQSSKKRTGRAGVGSGRGKAAGASAAARVTGIRHWSTPDYSRVAIDLEKEVKFDSRRMDAPDRIVFELRDAQLASVLVGKSFDVQDGFLKQIRASAYPHGKVRVTLEVDQAASYSAFLLPNPDRLIIDIHGKEAASAEREDSGEEISSPSEDDVTTRSVKPAKDDVAPRAAPAGASASRAEGKVPDEASAPTSRKAGNGSGEASSAKLISDQPVKESRRAGSAAREAKPTASGDRSLIRALGLKIGRIVIDPGHGGHDTGTIGPHGLQEKDLVLEVGLRLGRLLEKRLGAEIVYTRDDDTFIPLETRTAIANREQADLFVSIHANSSADPDARGVETYYLNFTSSPSALEVAARENAVSEKSIHELQDLVKKIALKEKIGESREFAFDVQQALHAGLAVKSPAIRDRGVKQAPFVVLIGANMPSILAEISFVSNPKDESNLALPAYRQRVAESLYRGISRYASGLSGVRVASRAAGGEGQ